MAIANTIELRKNYVDILDRVYKREALSSVLNSPRSVVRMGRHANEIYIPKLSVSGLGDYSRTEGYKDGAITIEYETKKFEYDRGIRLFADAMDVEESALYEQFVMVGTELQRTQVAPEGDAYTFGQLATKAGTSETGAYTTGEAVLEALRTATNAMDEAEVPEGDRYLFITPTLKGLVDDFSLANPNRSNAVLTRFAGIIAVPSSRFYQTVTLNSGEDSFGYTGATALNFLIVHKGAVIKFDKHVASRIFQPDELEGFDAYMLKYRKYGIVEVYDNKTAGVYVSPAGE